MSENNDELLLKANQFFRHGKLNEAIQLYEKMLQQNPQQAFVLKYLGLAYAQLNQMNTAIDFFQRALKVSPEDESLHNNLANAYKKIKNFSKAVEHYQIAIKIAPNYAQAHQNLANLYAATHYKKALQHYYLALQAEPDLVPAHFNLGLLFLKNQKLYEAEIQFKNVLALNPDHIDAAFYLGILFLEKNSLDPAKDYFNQVIALNINHIEALTNLGVIALKQDQGQLAVDFFTKALAINNQHREARNNLAATFMHYDRFENALMHYDVLLQQEPNHHEYLYNSGVAQMALGHLTEAMLHFEKLISLDANHFAALNNLAAIYIRLDDKNQARKLLERAISVNPQDESSRHMLSALAGEHHAVTSPQYAANLFNNYALYYDQHMKGQLHYSLPEHIAKLIHKLNILNCQHVIDLGCGTGLTGIILREISEHLTGVDISAKMLDRAKEKGIYDELVEKELLAFLHSSRRYYDLIVAADVLPYFGDLDPLFSAISMQLAHHSHFIFSTEISKTQPWHLQETARFSHNPQYIALLCEKNGLQLINQEEVNARKHEQHTISLMLYIAKKKS